MDGARPPIPDPRTPMPVEAARRRDLGTTALLLAATAAAVGAASAPLWWRLGPDVHPLFWHGIASGGSLIVAGAIASRWRSGRRIARLVLISAVLYFLAYLGASGDPGVWVSGVLLSSTWMAVAGHFILAFPEGTLRSAFERRVLAVMYIWTLAPRLSIFVLDQSAFGCTDCPPNPLLIRSEPDVARAVLALDGILPVVVSLLVLLALVRRWRGSTPPERRVLQPVFAALVVNVVVAAAYYAIEGLRAAGLVDAVAAEAAVIVQRSTVILIAVGVAVGFVRSVLARSAIGNLLVRIGQGETMDQLESDVAWALGDPGVAVAIRPRGATTFRDAQGRAVDLPDDAGRTSTRVDGVDGSTVALIHDASLVREQPELLDAVVAATRLALENRRLAAELEVSGALPRGLADRLLRDGARIGETRTLTISVLMSDVRGYVTLAEQADPERLAAQLNEHRAAMNRAIAAHGGTVLQFVGDAVFAVFGAPEALPDPARRAVRSALDMQSAQLALNAAWAASGRPPFGLGVSVTTGPVAAALLGSEEHVEYSVVGDVVNLAQRIQAWAATGEVVVDAATFDGLGRAVDADALPAARVKGRAAPVTAYRVRAAAVEQAAVPADAAGTAG